MRFYVSLHFQSLKAIKNGGASVHRANSELIRVSLTVFGKGEKANLSKGERNELAKFTSLLIKNYGG